MKKFEDFKQINESKDSIDNFVNDIEKTISSYFPKSHVDVGRGQTLGDPHIYIEFAVGADKKDWEFGIIHNDISFHRIHINDIENIDSGKMVFSPALGGRITTKPNDKYHAYGMIKTGLRKKTGTKDQILKHIDKYFNKFKKILLDNKDKLPDMKYEKIKDII